MSMYNNQSRVPCGDAMMRGGYDERMSCDGQKMPGKYDRRKALESIYELGFVLIEAGLYLDTHPDDDEAIAYFMDTKEKYNKMVKMYSQYYGPLNYSNVENDNYWTWVSTPMPWEVEG